MSQKILFNIIQVMVVLTFSPLVIGIMERLKERVQSKKRPRDHAQGVDSFADHEGGLSRRYFSNDFPKHTI